MLRSASTDRPPPGDCYIQSADQRLFLTYSACPVVRTRADDICKVTRSTQARLCQYIRHARQVRHINVRSVASTRRVTSPLPVASTRRVASPLSVIQAHGGLQVHCQLQANGRLQAHCQLYKHTAGCKSTVSCKHTAGCKSTASCKHTAGCKHTISGKHT